MAVEEGLLDDVDPPGLSHPRDIEIGKTYKILKGYGEGETGECIAKKETDFGHAWGTIKTETGEYPTRYKLLELVEG